MQRQMFALSERYYRRILYGSSILLSMVIIGALLFLCYSAFSQFQERQNGVFVSKREQIKTEVDRLSARVTQFSGMYHRLLRLSSNDLQQVDYYWPMLPAGNSIALSHENLTAIPFSLVSNNKADGDKRHSASLMLLLRQASALPIFNADEMGLTLDGYIYTSDHNFLAISPPLNEDEKGIVRQQGIKNFIVGMGEQVDAAFKAEMISASNVQGSTGNNIVWMNPRSSTPEVREAVTRVAVRMGLENYSVATTVFSISKSQFRQFFMKSENTPGLFVLDSGDDGQILTELDSEKEAVFAQRIQQNIDKINGAQSFIQHFHANGSFFITQQINGPDWNVVYVFDWHDIIDGLHEDFTTGALWVLFSLLFVWVATVYFDRFVIMPLQKKALALTEIRKFSQSIIDTLPVGIAVYADDTNEIVLQNAIAAQALENAGQLPENFYATLVKRCRLASHNVSGTSEQLMLESELILKDGSTSHYGVVWSQTRFSGRDVMLLGLIDISMHKAHEALVLESKAMAERANQAKSMFLAQISHEIRTPLHGAIGHMELLAQDRLSNEQHKRVELIRHTFDMLMALVNDILDVTKFESNAIRLNLKPVNVNDLLEECAQLFAPLAANKGLLFYCLTDSALEPLLIGDAQRLKQILQNLIGNAVKFTEKGEIRLSVTQVTHNDTDVRIRFEVADTGIGISPAAQQRIFESLEQADDTISGRFGGTGLGLSLCRHLVELMQGNITLSSEVGIGSRFGVEVALRVTAPVKQAHEGTLNGLTVALCCETPALHARIMAYLALWGARACDPASGIAAVRIVTENDEVDPYADSIMRTHGRTIVLGMDTTHYLPEHTENHCYVSLFDRKSWLKALLDRPESVPAITGKSKVGLPATKPLDILVAEDDPINRALTEHQLQALGYHVIRLTKDGEEALQAWHYRKPDILITDLGMPKLNGIALAREIKKHDPQAIIIAATAANPVSGNEGFEIFTEVMHKPTSLKDLQRMLSQFDQVPYETAGKKVEATRQPSLDQIMHDAFRASWPADKYTLEQAIVRQDTDKLVRCLHRLQGGMLAMGQDTLAAECLALQQAISNGEKHTTHYWQQWFAKMDHLIASQPA